MSGKMDGELCESTRMDAGKEQYLLNINTRTIHNAQSKDGRCRLDLISDNNKMLFFNYFEAKSFLPSGKKSASPCAFCLGNGFEETVDKK